MPDGISKANARQSAKSKRMAGNRAQAGLPAKAGRRKPPATKGKHITTAEQRKRARFLHEHGGLKPFVNRWVKSKGHKQASSETVGI
jgi:hypothetical protein